MRRGERERVDGVVEWRRGGRCGDGEKERRGGGEGEEEGRTRGGGEEEEVER